MRCAICLEEMDHPGIGVFSCPDKSKPWHTREYRRLKLELDKLEWHSPLIPSDEARKHEIEAQIARLKA
jgi:hypothetical protein